MNLFIYGVTERLSAIFGLQDISREAFWFSELGGSATDSFGVLYPGDVNAESANCHNQCRTFDHTVLCDQYFPGTGIFAWLSLYGQRKERSQALSLVLYHRHLTVCD